tara:strand:- start:30997 stop:31482 length:486 start_codon:yes stop_codon:yes gene_type:complete
MLNTPQFARDMKRGEEAEVDALLGAAFERAVEAKLVAALRKSRLIAGEQVMPMGDRIVGYYALSHMVKPKGWLCLAPVAIAPDMQGRGYGKRMMGMLSEWARITKTPIVVVGQAAFYEKAGFARAGAANLISPYPIDHTMVSGVTGAPAQTLVYPAAFDAL